MSKLHVEFELGDEWSTAIKERLEKIKAMRPHTINIVVRKDAKETIFQGDFLKMFDYLEVID